jgi:hypothetical protein
VNLNEAFLLAVGNCTINVVHWHSKCLQRYTPLERLLSVEADMGDFWVGVSTPGNCKSA